MYTYANGQWTFHRAGDVVVSDSVAIIFDQDDPFDVLHKHGPAEQIKTLFLSDAFCRMARAGCYLVMVKVKPEHCDLLNKCLSISASKWCTRLAKANSQQKEVAQ